MKLKKQKFFIWGLLVTMITMYGFLPIAPNALAIDAIVNAKDLISDSDAGVTATHTFTFTTGTTTPATGTWVITFPNEFDLTSAAAVAAWGDANVSEGIAGQVVTMTMTGDEAATSTQVVVSDVGNPTLGEEGTYTIDIENRDAGGAITLERVQVMVSIHQDVLMTATVDSILNFTISGIDAGDETVNGLACDNDTTATTTPFGTLIVDTASTVCQKLNVETNADYGYTVTVEQDQELTSDAGSNINSFNNSADGLGSTTAQAWAAPDNTLDVDRTYGHMGLTSDDQDLASAYPNQDFYNGGTTHFAGLNSSDPMPVMHHTGPSDGSTANIGETNVLYRVQIASLQEAGDYENTLTYIVTPTF